MGDRERRPDTDAPTGRIDLLHRAGAALLGLGLWVFGILGLVNRLDTFSTRGQPVLGLSSNGLLSWVSLVVGGILLAAAVRGGRTASTVSVVVGLAFLLSGFGHVLVLQTDLNFLAMGFSNVIFSLVAGGVLLILGAWGRFTGRLPSDNPYQRERHPEEGAADAAAVPTVLTDARDLVAIGELAEAERAAARNGATPAQARGLMAVGRARRTEDRIALWRSDQQSPTS